MKLIYHAMFNYPKFHDKMSQLGDISKKTLKRCHLDVRQLGGVGCGSDWVRVGSEWGQSGSEHGLVQPLLKTQHPDVYVQS